MVSWRKRQLAFSTSSAFGGESKQISQLPLPIASHRSVFWSQVFRSLPLFYSTLLAFGLCLCQTLTHTHTHTHSNSHSHSHLTRRGFNGFQLKSIRVDEQYLLVLMRLSMPSCLSVCVCPSFRLVHPQTKTSNKQSDQG